MTSAEAGSGDRRPRALTGDRPTGPLHLGHLVGTLQNRVSLQETHEAFVLVADLHMLTTRLDGFGDIETNIREDVLGNLAVGIDPDKATIYLQSQVPQTAELFLYFAMLVSVSRAQRIPTLKDKLRELRIARPSYGLLGYPILQAADILLMRADVVPVGPDQASHVELAREIARSFNERFAPVFPVPTALAPRGGTLPGTDGSPKMSRSLGNTINLFDDEETVRDEGHGDVHGSKPHSGDGPGTRGRQSGVRLSRRVQRGRGRGRGPEGPIRCRTGWRRGGQAGGSSPP